MKKGIYLVLILFSALSITAQKKKKKKDLESIKSMCGCFEVTFKFAETFNYTDDENYKPSKMKTSSALEWAELVKDDKNEISIQHLLVVGRPSDQFIIKHWRQDWIYENKDFYMYDGNNTWKYEEKKASEVKNQWTQKVFQVDDSPRYEGSGSWVHVDGKSYWESDTNAPLPRREYTKRSDYNITHRGNRHEITTFGWVHDQNNKKIIRKGKEEDILLAQEKGFNSYVKVDDDKCKAAQVWWKEKNEKWMKVRKKWDEVYARNKTLELKKKVENKVLYKHLFSENLTEENKIQDIIEAFVIK